MLDKFFLQEYHITDELHIYDGVIFNDYLELLEYTMERFNSSNIYEFKESESKESFIKCCSDEKRIFYVKKLN
tara:strand:- start:307 stop:525 length:219 start_codon:yes stop_codon:yes gene_type:complete